MIPYFDTRVFRRQQRPQRQIKDTLSTLVFAQKQKEVSENPPSPFIQSKKLENVFIDDAGNIKVMVRLPAIENLIYMNPHLLFPDGQLPLDVNTVFDPSNWSNHLIISIRLKRAIGFMRLKAYPGLTQNNYFFAGYIDQVGRESFNLKLSTAVLTPVGGRRAGPLPKTRSIDVSKVVIPGLKYGASFTETEWVDHIGSKFYELLELKAPGTFSPIPKRALRITPNIIVENGTKVYVSWWLNMLQESVFKEVSEKIKRLV